MHLTKKRMNDKHYYDRQARGKEKNSIMVWDGMWQLAKIVKVAEFPRSYE